MLCKFRWIEGLFLRRKIDNAFKYPVHFTRKFVECFVVRIGRQQMGADDGFAQVLIGNDVTGHVPDSLRRHQQDFLGFGQVAKLDGIVFREIGCSTVADDFADPAVPGYPEIVLRDGDFQFRQHVVVWFVRFNLVIWHEFAGGLVGAACKPE